MDLAGRAAGVVLAGGQSRRMGASKAALEWHGSTLLYRTCGLVGRCGPVVVVRSPGQRLPDLPPGVRIIDDPREGLGPLQGVAAGLAAVSDQAEVAFVCATDLPFLHPAFVRRVLGAFTGETDVVLPRTGGHPHPLAAGYRTTLASEIEVLLAAGHRRATDVADHARVLLLDEAALADDADLAGADPTLASVININDTAAYAAARRRPAPWVTVEGVGAVRAATVAAAAAAAAAAAEVALGTVVAVVNAGPPTRDGREPLAAGDHVAFSPAVRSVSR